MLKSGIIYVIVKSDDERAEAYRGFVEVLRIRAEALEAV
jgi:hypothetical protein